jgi:hypothetical protein
MVAFKNRTIKGVLSSRPAGIRYSTRYCNQVKICKKSCRSAFPKETGNPDNDTQLCIFYVIVMGIDKCLTEINLSR